MKKRNTRIYQSVLIKSLNCIKIDLVHHLHQRSTDTTTNRKSLNLFLIVEL